MAHRGFETFSDAFDYCREKNYPIQAVITGELVWMLYKFYPSGRCAFIRVVQKFEEIMEDTNVTN